MENPILPIEPDIIDGKYTPFHPALDFVNDTAHVTVPLPIKESTKKGVQVITEHFVVTDKRELFRFNEQELLRRGLFPSSKCVLIANILSSVVK